MRIASTTGLIDWPAPKPQAGVGPASASSPDRTARSLERRIGSPRQARLRPTRPSSRGSTGASVRVLPSSTKSTTLRRERRRACAIGPIQLGVRRGAPLGQGRAAAGSFPPGARPVVQAPGRGEVSRRCLVGPQRSPDEAADLGRRSRAPRRAGERSTRGLWRPSCAAGCEARCDSTTAVAPSTRRTAPTTGRSPSG